MELIIPIAVVVIAGAITFAAWTVCVRGLTYALWDLVLKDL